MVCKISIKFNFIILKKTKYKFKTKRPIIKLEQNVYVAISGLKCPESINLKVKNYHNLTKIFFIKNANNFLL